MESIEAAAPHLLSGGAVRISRGNALDPALLAEAGPFDAIHVGAAAAHPHMVRARRSTPRHGTPTLWAGFSQRHMRRCAPAPAP